jgi:hypothetical protein
MATVPVVQADQVRIVESIEARTRTYIAGVAVTRGQLLYRLANGNAGLAQANAVGTAKPVGFATSDVAAGQPVDVLHHGGLAGFDLAARNPGTTIYLSAGTAGAADDARTAALGTVVVPVAIVDCDTTPARRRFLFVDIRQAADPVAL